MLVVAKYNRTNAYEPENTNPFDVTTSWEIIVCPACDRVLFGEGFWHSILSDGSGPDYEVLHPIGPEQIRGLPIKISKAYEAAQKAKAIDSNAFAVLLGRVLDLVCMDKNAVGKDLFERLKDIADKDIMPQQLADMAHALRQLRNIGAHADLGELTNAEIPILEGLSKAILEYVYSAPALVEHVQSKINVLKGKKQQA